MIWFIYFEGKNKNIKVKKEVMIFLLKISKSMHIPF